MVKHNAATVEEYLGRLPEERRKTIRQVRETVLRNLPEGYRESMSRGMISYEIPLERYPDTYNGEPLALALLASQKRHNALYLMCIYQDPALEKQLRKAYEEAGIKPDMGKSCLRFGKPGDLPLEAIGRIIAGVTPEKFIARYEQGRKR